jgi:hypothetical protein
MSYKEKLGVLIVLFTIVLIIALTVLISSIGINVHPIFAIIVPIVLMFVLFLITPSKVSHGKEEV